MCDCFLPISIPHLCYFRARAFASEPFSAGFRTSGRRYKQTALVVCSSFKKWNWMPEEKRDWSVNWLFIWMFVVALLRIHLWLFQSPYFSFKTLSAFGTREKWSASFELVCDFKINSPCCVCLFFVKFLSVNWLFIKNVLSLCFAFICGYFRAHTLASKPFPDFGTNDQLALNLFAILK